MDRSNNILNIAMHLDSFCSSRLWRPKQEKAEKNTFGQTLSKAALHYHARSIFFNTVFITFLPL